MGLASGLFGVGGGFLMVPVQYWALGLIGVDPETAIRTAFGTSLAVVLPTAASGTWAHHCRQCISWDAVAWMAPSAAVCSFIGGALSTRLPARPLELLLGIVLIVAALRLFGRQECALDTTPRVLSRPGYLLLGMPIGLLSGLLGIGGGVVLVPVLIMLLGYPVRAAIGTSTPVILCAATGGVVSYALNGPAVSAALTWSIGYVHLAGLLALAAGSVPMAQLGARLAHACPPRPLRMMFAGVMALFGLLMIDLPQLFL